MAGVNKVFLVGNLGADVEMRYTPGGTAIANFKLATSETWVKDGQKEIKTEWHKVVAFNKLAEICGEYLAKGKQVFIEGKIQTRSWDDKDGNKKYMTEIVASQMVMLGSRDGGKAEEQEPEGQAISPDDIDDVPF